MTDATLKVAVVGAGQMGEHHLRIYSGLKGVDLVAVYDTDAPTAARAAALYGCRQVESLDELADLADAASVTVPSSRHAEIGSALLERGVHCLVEKPLATSEAECQRLIAAAEGSGAVLLVGHVERFNPVVEQLTDILSDSVIHAVDARRMSAVSARITDVDVVADLMIHDLDIVLALMRAPVSGVFAQGVHTAGGRGEDYVTAVLSFANGSMASLTASRITHNKVREIQVTADVGYITASYSNQTLAIYRQGLAGNLAGKPGSYALDLAIEQVFVRGGEPLLLEIQHFVDTIRSGGPPRVTGRAALEALRLAWRIQQIAAAASVERSA